MNNQIFEAVVFDMDGVVIDTRPPIEEFWYKLADKYQIVITPDMMEKQIHGCPARQTVYALFSHFSDETKEEILESCEYFETHLNYIAMAGVKELFAKLKERKIPVALVTSSLPTKVSNVVKQLQLEGVFNTIVTSDLVIKGKPDPACYRLAAELLGKKPESCIVFEDAVSGVKAARGAGMLTIGIGGKIQAPLLKEAGAQEVIPNFESVQVIQGDNGYLLQTTSALAFLLVNKEYTAK